VVGVLFVITVLRATHLDGTALVIGAIALTTWIYLPAWAVAMFALLTRRWLLAAAAITLIGVQLWVVLPEIDPFPVSQPRAAGWPRLRILDANLTWTNSNMDGIASEILRDRPDVVSVQEITPSDVAALRSRHVLEHFHWSLVAPSEHSEGMALWSDIPLTGLALWSDAGHPELRATVDIAVGTSLALLAVHTYIPVTLPVRVWKHELAGIAQAAKSPRGATLVIGDFNATWDMYEFQAILHAGYRDAAVVAGDGWQATWAPRAWLPPIVRIDHALVSPGVAVESYRLATDAGSEHKSILLTLAVRPGAA
jgi:endonuclease/exonuclease/phosphatase (EEP) superfamily protein YafD